MTTSPPVVASRTVVTSVSAGTAPSLPGNGINGDSTGVALGAGLGAGLTAAGGGASLCWHPASDTASTAKHNNWFFIRLSPAKRCAGNLQRIGHAIIRLHTQVGSAHEGRRRTALRLREVQRVLVSPRDLELAACGIQAY